MDKSGVFVSHGRNCYFCPVKSQNNCFFFISVNQETFMFVSCNQVLKFKFIYGLLSALSFHFAELHKITPSADIFSSFMYSLYNM